MSCLEAESSGADDELVKSRQTSLSDARKTCKTARNSIVQRRIVAPEKGIQSQSSHSERRVVSAGLRSNSWLEIEEVFIFGCVCHKYLEKGLLFKSKPASSDGKELKLPGGGSANMRASWIAIKKLYDLSWDRYQKHCTPGYRRPCLFRERSPTAMARHYKVMKQKLSKHKERYYFHKLYDKWSLIYNFEDRLLNHKLDFTESRVEDHEIDGISDVKRDQVESHEGSDSDKQNAMMVPSSENSRCNSWTREEEIILVGNVMERFLDRGSLVSARRPGTGRDNELDCWNTIKETFDYSASILIELKKVPRLTTRTTNALSRHYKVMKCRIEKTKGKDRLSFYFETWRNEYLPLVDEGRKGVLEKARILREKLEKYVELSHKEEFKTQRSILKVDNDETITSTASKLNSARPVPVLGADNIGMDPGFRRFNTVDVAKITKVCPNVKLVKSTVGIKRKQQDEATQSISVNKNSSIVRKALQPDAKKMQLAQVDVLKNSLAANNAVLSDPNLLLGNIIPAQVNNLMKYDIGKTNQKCQDNVPKRPIQYANSTCSLATLANLSNRLNIQRMTPSMQNTGSTAVNSVMNPSNNIPNGSGIQQFNHSTQSSTAALPILPAAVSRSDQSRSGNVSTTASSVNALNGNKLRSSTNILSDVSKQQTQLNSKGMESNSILMPSISPISEKSWNNVIGNSMFSTENGRAGHGLTLSNNLFGNQTGLINQTSLSSKDNAAHVTSKQTNLKGNSPGIKSKCLVWSEIMGCKPTEKNAPDVNLQRNNASTEYSITKYVLDAQKSLNELGYSVVPSKAMQEKLYVKEMQEKLKKLGYDVVPLNQKS